MHTKNYFEYVLGDRGYPWVDQYIVCGPRHHEVPEDADNDALYACKL